MDKRAKLTKKNKFTEQETLRFVREYLNNSCLWSVSNPDYKNKTIKQEKYQNLYLSFKNVTI